MNIRFKYDYHESCFNLTLLIDDRIDNESI